MHTVACSPAWTTHGRIDEWSTEADESDAGELTSAALGPRFSVRSNEGIPRASQECKFLVPALNLPTMTLYWDNMQGDLGDA